MLALSQLYLSYAALWAIKAGLVLLNNFDRYSAALKLLGRQGRDGDRERQTSPVLDPALDLPMGIFSIESPRDSYVPLFIGPSSWISGTFSRLSSRSG